MNSKINIIYDMETFDTDDYFALCILTYHPAVNLRAVNITPGDIYQVGFVRHILKLAGLADIPIGSFNPLKQESSIKQNWYDLIGASVPPDRADEEGYVVIYDILKKYPDTIVVTGGPLKNLHKLLDKREDIVIKTWVGQGGFAGDNLVPPENRLKKFEGKETYIVTNFNGDIIGAEMMLSSPKVSKRFLVSKNVTHAVCYDSILHEILSSISDKPIGMKLLFEGMERRVKKYPPKKFHDPLAVCVAIDNSVCAFEEVEVYRVKNEWGSRKSSGTNTYITVSVNIDKFRDVIAMYR